mgnify:FL=1
MEIVKVIFRMLSDINMTVEYLLFFCLFFHREYKKPDRKKAFLLIVCLCVWLITSVCGLWLQKSSIGPFPILLLLLYVIEWCLFEVSVIEVIATGLGQWLFISMLENALYIVLSHNGWESMYLNNLIMLILSIIFFALLIFLMKYKKLPVMKLSIKVWFLIDVIMLVLTSMMMFFSYILDVFQLEGRTFFAGQVLMAFGQILIIILLYGIIFSGHSIYELRRQKEISEIQNKLQREYFQKLLARETETKRFRHDIINDLLQFQNYCANKKYDKLEHYLENTLGAVYEIHNNYYNVGNDIVNTVLNYYLLPLKESHTISVQGYISGKISMDERELCVLVSNMVKNATEALQKIKDGYLWIKIREGEEFLYIEVKNSFQGEVVFDKKGMPISSKKNRENHGIGTYNIIDIAKKNGGTYQIEIEEHVFKAEVYLRI